MPDQMCGFMSQYGPPFVICPFTPLVRQEHSWMKPAGDCGVGEVAMFVNLTKGSMAKSA